MDKVLIAHEISEEKLRQDKRSVKEQRNLLNAAISGPLYLLYSIDAAGIDCPYFLSAFAV